MLSLHLLLGRRLAARGLISCSAEAFARARARVETQALANGHGAVTLDGIHDELQFALGHDAATRAQIRSVELELAAELRHPLPGAAGLDGAAPVAARSELNRYEACAESFAFATDGLASLLAGAARRARGSVPAVSDTDAALRDVAAGVGGPALVGFVLWVLAEAQRRGLRRLYFVARDGWILLQIAQKLIARLGLDCEAYYLYGGRQAWYIPTISGVSEADLFWAVDYQQADTSVESFLARIGVAAAEIEGELRELGFERDGWAEPQPPAALDRVWSVVRTPSVADLVLARAAHRRAVALDYFEQEGLLGRPDWALVDVGWRGRVVGALNRILATRGAGVPAVFFFGRSRDSDYQDFGGVVPIHAFFFDRTRRLGFDGKLHAVLLELFCGAEHGTTIGYERSASGTVVPVLDDERNERLTRWGLPLVHESILAFVDQLWLDPATLDLNADTRPLVAALLSAFSASPTPEEAAAWGAYPFEYGRTGRLNARLASPFGVRHMPRALLEGRLATRGGFEWPEAGLALSPAPIRLGLRALLGVRERAQHNPLLRALKRLRSARTGE